MKTNKLFKIASIFAKYSSIGAYRNPKLSDEFWRAYDAMCSRLKVDPAELAAVIQSESGFNPKAVNYVMDAKTGKKKLDKDGKPIAQAKGLNQLIHSTAKGLNMPEETWQNFENLSATDQLEYVEKYFQKNPIAGLKRADIYAKNFGGFNNPDGSLYASKSHIESSPQKDLFKNPEYQNKAYEQNRALDKDHKGYIAKSDLARLVGNA
jgi:hypothetical protein